MDETAISWGEFDLDESRPLETAPATFVLREAWKKSHNQSLNSNYYGDIALDEIYTRLGVDRTGHGQMMDGAVVEKYAQLHNLKTPVEHEME